jgi:hypothetical protein
MATIIDKIFAWVGWLYSSASLYGQVGTGVLVGAGVLVGGGGGAGRFVGVEVGVWVEVGVRVGVGGRGVGVWLGIGVRVGVGVCVGVGVATGVAVKVGRGVLGISTVAVGSSAWATTNRLKGEARVQPEVETSAPSITIIKSNLNILLKIIFPYSTKTTYREIDSIQSQSIVNFIENMKISDVA